VSPALDTGVVRHVQAALGHPGSRDRCLCGHRTFYPVASPGQARGKVQQCTAAWEEMQRGVATGEPPARQYECNRGAVASRLREAKRPATWSPPDLQVMRSRRGWDRVNASDLDRTYSDPAFRDRFLKIASIYSFYNTCFAPASYQPNMAVIEVIRLTRHGESLVRSLTRGSMRYSPAVAHFAVFNIFHHEHLLVDVMETVPEQLVTLLATDIVRQKVRFAWIFGRILYDRYYDTFNRNVDELTGQQTEGLLSDTPMGVFQLSDLVVGPFGVLRSSTRRNLPPTRNIGLYHCPDPSCGIVHRVALQTGDHPVSRAIRSGMEKLSADGSLGSDWDGFYSSLISDESYYADDNPMNLPVLISDAFSPSERSLLLSDVLQSDASTIRPLLPTSVTGSPKDIAESVDVAGTLQLLLLVSDESLTAALERLIYEKRIVVPDTETRAVRGVALSAGWLGEACECSRLGVRFRPTRANMRAAKLRKLVLDAYEASQDLLMYKLRYYDGSNLQQKVDAYVQNADAQQIVDDLLFSNPGQLARATRSLKYGHFPQPRSADDEAELSRKVLWKLGFDQLTYPRIVSQFWDYLGRFRQACMQFNPSEEQGRESIRSIGVNLFVALEAILDSALSFTCWAVFQDHYRRTNFVYRPSTARSFMAETLVSVPGPDGKPLLYDAGGRNTLGPLISGLTGLATLMTEQRENSAEYKCEGDELPKYFDKTKLELFPFQHRRAMYDMDTSDLDALIETLTSARAGLDRSHVAAVRNWVDHHRLDFPSKQEMEEMCVGLATEVRKLEVFGLIPLLNTFAGTATDSYRLTHSIVRDYAGRETVIIEPVEFRTHRMPGARTPQVVLRGVRVFNQTDRWRFTYAEESQYRDMWSDYPRRRETRPTGEAASYADVRASVS
jgi:hypothetical protein